MHTRGWIERVGERDCEWKRETDRMTLKGRRSGGETK